jgi:NAD(P)-dependent dehydrogenase (short-subunit alcohol dehydrogenase family)
MNIRFDDQAVLITGASTGIGAAFFLASNAMSSYDTGQIIEVNGGQLMP